MSDTYKPIDCNFYDILEAYATRQRVCIIQFKENEVVKTVLNTFIVNIFTENKEEFMQLSTGELFRLDKLIAIDNFLLPNNSACNF